MLEPIALRQAAPRLELVKGGMQSRILIAVLLSAVAISCGPDVVDGDLISVDAENSGGLDSDVDTSDGSSGPGDVWHDEQSNGGDFTGSDAGGDAGGDAGNECITEGGRVTCWIDVGDKLWAQVLMACEIESAVAGGAWSGPEMLALETWGECSCYNVIGTDYWFCVTTDDLLVVDDDDDGLWAEVLRNDIDEQQPSAPPC